MTPPAHSNTSSKDTRVLTIKDLNCSTCTDITCWLCKGNAYFDKVMALPKTTEAREHKEDIGIHRQHVLQKGCASHPLALQVLAAPVIAELERQNAHNEKDRRLLNRDEQERLDIIERCNNRTIALLKGDH